MPTAASGMKRRDLIDLLTKIGRCVKQEPLLTVGRYRQRRLDGKYRFAVAGPRRATDIAVTVPLRKPPPAAAPNTLILSIDRPCAGAARRSVSRNT